jgi:hypothetical protein
MQGFVKVNVDNTTIDGIIPVPIGTIVSYLPGYFGNNSNGSYTGVALTLPDGWVACNGTQYIDILSPIFSSTGRYLPKLDDSRFIQGNVTAVRGVAGGRTNNEYTLTVANLPQHSHTLDHTHIWSGSAENCANLAHSHTMTWFTADSGGAQLPGVVYAGSSAGTTYTSSSATSLNHNHNITNTNGNSTYTGNSGNYPTNNTTQPFSILPKYISVTYIMKVK